MAEEIGWASLGIVPTLDRNFGSKLDRQLSPSLSRVGSSAGKKFGSILGKSAVAASAGIIGAGFAALKLGKAAFAEAEESLKVGRLTTSQIKATGGAANVSAKQIGNLSNQLSKKAGIDDEVIQSGANLLLTFKNVRNEAGKGNKIFNKASKATLDLAATMAASKGGDIDLKAASIQVGKALNDPIKGITALGRVGVQFTEQQKAQIKTLVDQGDLLGAQKIILGELNGEMKGAAQSQATSWDRLGVAWKNAEEKLGNALLPVIKDASKFLIREGIPVVNDWIDAFEKKGIPALKHFYEKAKPVVEDALPKFKNLLGIVKDDLAIAAPYAKDLVDAFVGMPDWAKKLIVGGGLAAFAGNKLGLGFGGKGAAGGLLGLVTKAKPLPVFVVNNGVGGTGLPGVPTTEGGKGAKGGILKGAAALLPLLPAAGAVGASIPQDDKQGKTFLNAEDFANQVRKQNGGQGIAQAKRDLGDLLFEPLGPNGRKIKVPAKFDLLGMIEADAQVEKFRKKAGRPVEVPIVAKIDDAIAGLFGDAFGGTSSSAGLGSLLRGPISQRGLPGVTVHGDLNIQATDHKDFLHKAQRAALGGRP